MNKFKIGDEVYYHKTTLVTEHSMRSYKVKKVMVQDGMWFYKVSKIKDFIPEYLLSEASDQ